MILNPVGAEPTARLGGGDVAQESVAAGAFQRHGRPPCRLRLQPPGGHRRSESDQDPGSFGSKPVSHPKRSPERNPHTIHLSGGVRGCPTLLVQVGSWARTHPEDSDVKSSFSEFHEPSDDDK